MIAGSHQLPPLWLILASTSMFWTKGFQHRASQQALLLVAGNFFALQRFFQQHFCWRLPCLVSLLLVPAAAVDPAWLLLLFR